MTLIRIFFPPVRPRGMEKTGEYLAGVSAEM